jgi:hypothetical protein
MFICAVTGALAQDWEWSQPKVITPDSAYVDIEFYPDYTAVNVSVDWSSYEPLAFAGTKASALAFSDDTISGNGTDLFTIKELFGHITIAMTERYSHVSANALKSAVKQLENGGA